MNEDFRWFMIMMGVACVCLAAIVITSEYLRHQRFVEAMRSGAIQSVNIDGEVILKGGER